MREKTKRFIPFVLFAAFAALMALALFKGKEPAPSALLGKPAPEFQMNDFSSRDLRQGRVSVVNFFASWCLPCAAEQSVLQDLAKRGIPVFGVAYKDRRDAVAAFLAREGDPFRAVGHDETGRKAIDWGVYGVPETFVVSGKGIILYRHVGALTSGIVEKEIVPLLEVAK